MPGFFDAIKSFFDDFSDFWVSLRGDDPDQPYIVYGPPATPPFNWQSMMPMILLGGGLLLAITILRK